jgi:hypothetical protein
MSDYTAAKSAILIAALALVAAVLMGFLSPEAIP